MKELNISKGNVLIILEKSTQNISFIFRHSNRVYRLIFGTLRDLVPFAPFKKRENTHGDAILLRHSTLIFSISKVPHTHQFHHS